MPLSGPGLRLAGNGAHWDMPILLVGGWYDSYTRATFQNFVGLGAGGRRPVRALMGP
jgi:predicted acyl esterase